MTAEFPHEEDAMHHTPTPTRVMVRAPGKINLQLAVGGLDTDGYHALASVFLAVDCYDHITATPLEHGRFEVRVTGVDTDLAPTDERNIAVRAARLLAGHFDAASGVQLNIAKTIPVAAGMAGGSADAAAALLACDTLWNTGATSAQLRDLAARLGSDVPFALLGGAALGTGRGDRLTPLPVRDTYHWAIAVANRSLPTADVYREYERLRHERRRAPERQAASHLPVPCPTADSSVLRALEDNDPRALGTALTNDLQAAALSLCPALASTLRAGTDAGALGSLVCGSGPTTAFLAVDSGHAELLARALTRSGSCRYVRTARGPVAGAALVHGLAQHGGEAPGGTTAVRVASRE